MVCTSVGINNALILISTGIAIQHVCMAKALILEHDLQNISPGFYDAHRTKVCPLTYY